MSEHHDSGEYFAPNRPSSQSHDALDSLARVAPGRPPRPSAHLVSKMNNLQLNDQAGGSAHLDQQINDYLPSRDRFDDVDPIGEPLVGSSTQLSSASFHSVSEPQVASSSGHLLETPVDVPDFRIASAHQPVEQQIKAHNKKGHKRLEQREAIIMELIQSERDYLLVLKKTRDIFYGDRYNAKLIGVDLDAAFGNLDEVIDVGEDLLRNLELHNMSKYDRDKCIGLCFIDIIERLQAVYGEYCRQHDSTMWQRYNESEATRRYMNGKLEELKDVVDCFDIPTILIKPVQRLAKYPLLLNELNAVTDTEHPDKKNLDKSVKLVTDAVMAINQMRAPSALSRSSHGKHSNDNSSSRRDSANQSADGGPNKKLPITDAFDMTKSFHQDKPFMDWLSSKLSLHSFKKKTSRLSTRISATLGLGTLTRDEEFERIHDAHKNLKKMIRCFSKDLSSFLEHLEAFMYSMQRTSEQVKFSRDPCPNQNELVEKCRLCVDGHHHEFKRIVDRQVISIINQLMAKFAGPANLIIKRHDKLLDYDSKTRKLEACKNLDKRECLRDQQLKAKELYDCLNRRLIDQLPSFNSSAMDIFKDCLIVFLKARGQFVSRYTHEAVSLLESSPLLRASRGSTSSTSSSPASMVCTSMSDIVEQFNAKHSMRMAELFDREQLLPSSMFHQSTLNQAKSASSSDRLRADNYRNETRENVGARHSVIMRSSSPICSTPDNAVFVGHNDRSGSAASTRSSCGIAVTSSIDSSNSGGGGSVDLNALARSAMSQRTTQQIYVASWPFAGSEANQLNLSFGQQVIMIKNQDERGNSEWSLVEDRSGKRGYVPSAYIKLQQ